MQIKEKQLFTHLDFSILLWNYWWVLNANLAGLIVFLAFFGFFSRNVWGNILSMAWKRSVLAPVLFILFSIFVSVMIWIMRKGVYLLMLQMT